jgi:hypothetical protein
MPVCANEFEQENERVTNICNECGPLCQVLSHKLSAVDTGTERGSQESGEVPTSQNEWPEEAQDLGPSSC